MSNDSVRYFQWLVGERQGEVIVFDHIEEDEGVIYLCFKDNSRINEALVAPLNQLDATNKMMAEVDNPNNIWSFKSDWVGRTEEIWALNESQEKVCVQPLVEGRKVIKLTPPRKTAAKTSSFGNIVNQTPAPVQVPIPTTLLSNLDKTDPVFIMMSKSKKVDNDVEMTITIAMPPKSLYDVAEESFEDGGNKVVEYIIENIHIKDIQEALKIAIKNMYES